MTNSDGPALIADIGGTNARFALIDTPGTEALSYSKMQRIKCENYSTVGDALRAYLKKHGMEGEGMSLCIAAAAPVLSEWTKFTNNHWSFSKAALAREMKLAHIEVINDYAALSHALPHLAPQDCLPLNSISDVCPRTNDDGLYAVLGPGTGMGVGGLIINGESKTAIVTEYGHASFAPSDEFEIEILNRLRRNYQRVSWERILSGPGLVNLYQALAEISSVEPKSQTASLICQSAVEDSDPLCTRTFNIFCNILGSFAGDVALSLGAFRGVYLAGGILPKYSDFLLASNFREHFENKGRYQKFMHGIPTILIKNENPGLLGAAAYMSDSRAMNTG